MGEIDPRDARRALRLMREAARAPRLSVRRARGEDNGSSKLTAALVRRIRGLVELGFSQRAVAAHFRLSQSTVSDIVARRLWAHVEGADSGALERVTEAELREHAAASAGSTMPAAPPGRGRA